MQRLLKVDEAAAYCGLPARSFKKHMPIQPIRLGPHELWDIRKLDAFIDGLQGDQPSGPKDWTEHIERYFGSRRRGRRAGVDSP